jgi:hypothetical protein
MDDVIVVDFDDFSEWSNRYDLLHELKAINPTFRCSVFAIPGLGSDEFWASVPRWIELCVHGWLHETPRECERWTREQIEWVLDSEVVRRHFVNGWKSPGWLTSPAIYEVLLERGWWIADQHLADHLRPSALRTYLHEDGDNWHGHISNVCGNGIEETWPALKARVEGETEFRFASEIAR